MSLNYHFIKARGAHHKSTLDPNAVRSDPAHRKRGIIAVVVDEQYGTLKLLDTFPVAFLDLNMYTDGVARLQFGNIGIFGCFYGFHQVTHDLLSLPKFSYT